MSLQHGEFDAEDFISCYGVYYVEYTITVTQGVVNCVALSCLE